MANPEATSDDWVPSVQLFYLANKIIVRSMLLIGTVLPDLESKQCVATPVFLAALQANRVSFMKLEIALWVATHTFFFMAVKAMEACK